MNIAIVTLFPEMFTALTEYGVSGRAVKQGLVQAQCWNPRDFTKDKHRTVDDRPYGGGPGMLMKTEPVIAAIDAAREELTEGSNSSKPKVLCLSPQGKRLKQKDIARLAKESSLILLCGRYEGIDERVIETQVDEEYSLGDYVISGGELAAMVLMDAMIRLQDEALGHKDSAAEDSFSTGLLEYPHYTRPEEFAGHKVPEVLLSGDHAAIARWRLKQSLGRTWLRRPDLLHKFTLDDEQKVLLEEFINEQES
ncbi:MAG: tRNA (guanosine(37)-N1)-methyltransferase TrmD [SAR86 cluster bacterium]|uniref:tRNA (guanine-N(1)-)-methyltransferase n=1 Tax=SAR86 cluster bacterium TaxID=2030880 RepID=A0A2A5CD58_9GAMM|nr:MAG: tRNA (guanosine(37)-N1)-methyltransferase TrmD [SAR86 cluster bacterium]